MIAASAELRSAFSATTGSMPASRTSRPSCRRKLRASITAATRPPPCGSKEHPAASAGRAAASTRLHVNTAATNRLQRPAVLRTGFITLLSVRLDSCMLATILNHAFYPKSFW
jgi:hypothetical protein